MNSLTHCLSHDVKQLDMSKANMKACNIFSCQRYPNMKSVRFSPSGFDVFIIVWSNITRGGGSFAARSRREHFKDA